MFPRYRANWSINKDSVSRSTRPPSIYSNQITAWYSWPGQTWRLNLISLTREDCYGGTCGVWPLWSHEKSCFCKFIVHCKIIVLPPLGNLEANMSWVDQVTLSLAERLFSRGTLTMQVGGQIQLAGSVGKFCTSVHIYLHPLCFISVLLRQNPVCDGQALHHHI